MLTLDAEQIKQNRLVEAYLLILEAAEKQVSQLLDSTNHCQAENKKAEGKIVRRKNLI